MHCGTTRARPARRAPNQRAQHSSARICVVLLWNDVSAGRNKHVGSHYGRARASLSARGTCSCARSGNLCEAAADCTRLPWAAAKVRARLGGSAGRRVRSSNLCKALPARSLWPPVTARSRSARRVDARLCLEPCDRQSRNVSPRLVERRSGALRGPRLTALGFRRTGRHECCVGARWPPDQGSLRRVRKLTTALECEWTGQNPSLTYDQACHATHCSGLLVYITL